MNFKTSRFLSIMGLIVCFLLAQLIIMQLTKEVNWDSFDFILASVLLFCTAIAFEFACQKIKSMQKRILIGGLIILALILFWAELAIGIFGSSLSGN